MYIKKFTASTVKEAMREIKAEFGDNALILNTKRLNAGRYEVVAAVDYDLSEPVDLNIAGAAFKAGGVNPPVKNPAEAAPNKAHGTGQAANKRPAARAALNAEAAGLAGKNEIKELKELFWTMFTQGKSRVSEEFSRLEEDLVKNGIDRKLAQTVLINAVNASKERAADIDYLKNFLRKKMHEKMSVADPLASRGIVTFIGPAGVGKTTTIAKLAAIHALKKKKRMALLTMDTYRIAAAEQLRVYGKIIGVPVEVAKNARELAHYIGIHSDKDLILIDTAGRSQRNGRHMKELAEIAAISPAIRFNLVLSTPTRDEALYECVKAFSVVPVGSLTFTKLDECGVFGPIINTMILSRKPVAYLTVGQRVPEDIELATRERLLNFFMPN